MARAVVITIAILLGAACRAAEPDSAVGPAAGYLAAKAEWERKLALIHAGLARPSAHRILKMMGKERRGQWLDRSEERRPHDLYWLDKEGSWRLHVTYTIDGAVESCEVFRPDFHDLRDRIPEGLYPYLKLIHESPGFRGASFNPVKLIRAVNGLHPIGKDAALKAMSAYLRLSHDPTFSYKYDLGGQRIFLVLRLLFVRKDGDPVMPPVRIGAMWPVRDKEHHDEWPLYPLAVVDDVPFLVASWVGLAGVAQSPAAHIEYAKLDCVLRDGPLVPRGSPMAAAEQLVSSARWKRMCPHAEEAEPVLHQACTAIRHLIEPRQSPEASIFEWNEEFGAARELDVVWDAKMQVFKMSRPPQ